MAVSVSPLVTTCVLLLLGPALDPTPLAAGDPLGVGSPIMTPGWDVCCSIFRICWERASIFVLISSIFFVSASICGEGELSGDWAKVMAIEITKAAAARNFIAATLA